MNKYSTPDEKIFKIWIGNTKCDGKSVPMQLCEKTPLENYFIIK